MTSSKGVDISFIVPAYNEAKGLPDCLKHIISELNKNPRISGEILVVNNASKDDTKKVAENFAPAVKVIDEPKKGLVFARACGAKHASGQLLAHVDADCLLPTGWLNTVIEEFKKNNNLVALSGPNIYYDLSRLQQALIKFYYYLFLPLLWVTKKLFKIGHLLQGGNFIVRKDAWDRMETISEEFNFYGEDTILAKNLSKLGEVKFTFKLPIYASGRRLKKEGLALTAGRYVLNIASTMIFTRPATKKYEDIRPG
jgi:glycosyltransferase involved in cell wall biosynthesis